MAQQLTSAQPDAHVSCDDESPRFALLSSSSSDSSAATAGAGAGVGLVSSSLPEWARPAVLPHTLAANERTSKSNRRRSRSDTRLDLQNVSGGAGSIPIIDDSLSSSSEATEAQPGQSPATDALLFKVPPSPNYTAPVFAPIRSATPTQTQLGSIEERLHSNSGSHPHDVRPVSTVYPQTAQSGRILARSFQHQYGSSYANTGPQGPSTTVPEQTPAPAQAEAQRDMAYPNAFDPASLSLPFTREILEAALLLDQINSRHAPASHHPPAATSARTHHHHHHQPYPDAQRTQPLSARDSNSQTTPTPFVYTTEIASARIEPQKQNQIATAPKGKMATAFTATSTKDQNSASDNGLNEASVITGQMISSGNEVVEGTTASQRPGTGRLLSRAVSQSQICSISSSIIQPTRLTGAKLSRGTSFNKPQQHSTRTSDSSTYATAQEAAEQPHECSQIEEESDELPVPPLSGAGRPSSKHTYEDESLETSVQFLSSNYSESIVPEAVRIRMREGDSATASATASGSLRHSIALPECSSSSTARREDPFEAAVDGALELHRQDEVDCERQTMGGGEPSYSSSLASSLSHLSLDAAATSSQSSGAASVSASASASDSQSQSLHGTSSTLSSSVQLFDGAHSVSDWSVRSEPLARTGISAGTSASPTSHSRSSHALDSATAHSTSATTAAAASASASASAQSLTFTTQQQQHRTPHRPTAQSQSTVLQEACTQTQAAAAATASTAASTAASTVDHTRHELIRLLETVVNDLDMPLKVKAQRLKKVRPHRTVVDVLICR